MFLTLSCVSASDEGIIISNIDSNGLDDDINWMNEENLNSLASEDSNVLADDGSVSIDDDVDEGNFGNDESNETEIANFTELADLIDNSEGIIELTKDYEALNDSDNLTIVKSLEMYGNNHTINCKNSSIIIDANDSIIVFENINFVDSYFFAEDVHNLNISFNDCNFEYFLLDDDITVVQEPLVRSTTGPIDNKVKKLALSIIGKSSGLAACKKLAIWVGKNIIHESNPGFYQSPTVTLNRKRGNCCCQADLFLHMCAAVGLTKTYKFYYMHVGQAYFQARHFFVMVDNILVDVDGKPDDPWGHASIGDRGLYRVTAYPYLPLKREY